MDNIQSDPNQVLENSNSKIFQIMLVSGDNESLWTGKVFNDGMDFNFLDVLIVHRESLVKEFQNALEYKNKMGLTGTLKASPIPQPKILSNPHIPESLRKKAREAVLSLRKELD